MNSKTIHCDVTRMMVSKGTHPHLALYQADELLRLSKYVSHMYFAKHKGLQWGLMVAYEL